ncbi:MAG: EAL domain-containing protein [Desulfopila sp.]|nr:EAL domain-containing protein [Desulfopila sp.]
MQTLRIKYQLMLWFSLLFGVVLASAGWVIYSLVHGVIEKNVINQLSASTKSIQTTITTAVDVSIRNHLRAIAEKNHDILNELHRKTISKELTVEEARKQGEEILLSQTIGETGYIYALRGDGILAVHPIPGMKNRDISEEWLAARQLAEQEGYLEYDWRNEGESEKRPKSLYMKYFEAWDWIISASSYRNEFLSFFKIEDFKNGMASFRFGTGGFASIISAQGKIIYHPLLSERNTGTEIDYAPLLPKMLQLKNGHLVQEDNDTTSGLSRERLLSFLYMPDFEWFVVSSVPLAEVYAPLKKLRNIIFLTIFCTILLIVPLSLSLGASITRPLTRLIGLMSKSPNDEHPVISADGASGEVGFLAGQYNKFIHSLQQSTRALQGEISERIHAEQQLKLFAKVFEHALEGISITDAEGNIVAVNQAFTEITGFTEDEVIGQNPRILKSDRHDHEYYRNMWKNLTQNGHWSGEIWNRRKNGEAYPEILSISSIRNDQNEVSHYVAVFHDITEMKTKEEQIKHQAYHDALTGLPNRYLAKDRLTVSLANARRKETSVAVLFMDLDNFKRINDSLGHAAGDLLLQDVASRLQKLVREGDTVARLGGDEFQIIAVGLTSEDQVVDLAGRIIQGFVEPFTIESHELFATISIGAAIFPQDGRDAETLTKSADTAMYQAKQRGKNTFALFTRDLSEQAQRRLQLEAEFRQALQKKEFTVFYQPKIEPLSGLTTSVEALVRWHKNDGSLVSPADFIPLAEETGLIIPLGDFVLDSAREAAQLLGSIGFGTIKIAINLSPHQFKQADMVDNILAIVERNNISVSQLELEITETTMVTDIEDSVAKLNRLVNAGFSISIDDFGTGYSSLYYLKALPIDNLKIDRSFITDITTDRDDAEIVETILLMAKNLGLNVVAEGVETEEQLEILKKFGCRAIQGYYYSPPLPLESLIQYLDRNKQRANITSTQQPVSQIGTPEEPE